MVNGGFNVPELHADPLGNESGVLIVLVKRSHALP